MKCFLKNKDEIVAEIILEPSDTYQHIQNLKILNKDKLPEIMKFSKNDEEFLGNFMLWLRYRIIPDERYNLDETLIKLLDLDYAKFGRMFGYQAIPAFLSHYASWFDDFYIDVERFEKVYYGHFEPKIDNMWLIKPYRLECPDKKHPHSDADVFLKNQKENPPKNFCSFSYTIISQLKTWFEEENGRIFLCQGIENKRDEERVKKLIEISKKYIPERKIEIKDNIVYTDYTDIVGVNMTRAWDFLDVNYMKQDLKWDEYITKNHPEYKEIVKTLRQIYNEAKENKVELLTLDIGIGVLQNRIFPVIIF